MIVLRYSRRPLRRGHSPGLVGGHVRYENQRDCLRLDFDFRCVYCLASEKEVAPLVRYGGFEIEHFRPKSLDKFRHLRHAYSNLLWACQECNRAKGSRWPSRELEAAGYRFVDPSAEGAGKHLEISDEGRLLHRTLAGEYTVRQLNLNSELHQKRRVDRLRQQRRVDILVAVIEGHARAIDGLTGQGKDATEEAALLETQRKALNELLEQIRPGLPHDDPKQCRACLPPAVRVDRLTELQD